MTGGPRPRLLAGQPEAEPGSPLPHSDPQWCLNPRAVAPVPQNSYTPPPSSAKPNRDFAEELLQAARTELSRQADRHVPTIEEKRVRTLRREIETTRQRGNRGEDVGERLRELGREHYRHTGTGGGS